MSIAHRIKRRFDALRQLAGRLRSQSRLARRLRRRHGLWKPYPRFWFSVLCIEGYPRSGNSLACRKFLHANRPAVPIFGLWRLLSAHHTHDPESVHLAVLSRIPTIILVRRPLDAIVSHLIYRGVPPTREEILSESRNYADFYTRVMAYRDRVVFIGFETVLTDFNGVLRLIADKYGRHFRLLDDEAAVTRRLSANGGESLKAGVPSADRAALKKRILEDFPHDALAPADRVYRVVSRLIVTP